MGFTVKDLIHEDTIVIDMEASTKEEVFQKIEDLAYEKGYVQKGYGAAILKREVSYPTALPTEILKVAIPHPMAEDQGLVINPTIIVARLAHPVPFIMMGSSDEPCDVDIVFSLAVKGSEDQLTILQDLISLFSDAASMQKFKDAKSPAEINDIIFDLID